MTTWVDVGRFPLCPRSGWPPLRPRPRSAARALRSSVPFVSMFRPRGPELDHRAAALGATTASNSATEPAHDAVGPSPAPAGQGGADLGAPSVGA